MMVLILIVLPLQLKLKLTGESWYIFDVLNERFNYGTRSGTKRGGNRSMTDFKLSPIDHRFEFGKESIDYIVSRRPQRL